MIIAIINQILLQYQPLIVLLLTAVLIPQVTIFVRKELSKLPANRRAILANIVSTAVTAVEQVTRTTNDTPEEKRALALQFIHDALKPFGLQVPDSELIPLIEEAVYLINLAEGKVNMPGVKYPCPGTEASHPLDKVR